MIGRYEENPFTKMRQIVAESVEHGLKKHHMYVLLELDITKAKELIRQQKQRTGETTSFTAFIVKSIGQAVSEHKDVHALRKGKKIIIFDDIDISVMVERIIDGNFFPTVFVIRKTNEKSVKEIHKEIIRVFFSVDSGLVVFSVLRLGSSLFRDFASDSPYSYTCDNPSIQRCPK